MLNHSPSIVTNGLVFYYDMNNTKKSFKGMPTTNYQTYPEASWDGSALANISYNYAGPSGTSILSYEVQPNNPIGFSGVMKYVSPTAEYKYFAVRATGLAAGTYTMSYYTKLLYGSPSTLNNAQLWRMNGVDQGVSGDWNPTHQTYWKRWVTTGPVTGSNSTLEFFPIHNSPINGDFVLYLCGFQLELGSVASSFINGSRTTALVDLTGNNTLTVNNLTYASDNTFTFNGASSSSSVITTSMATVIRPRFTIDGWIYDTKGSGYRAIAQNNSSSDGALYLAPSSNYLYMYPSNASSLAVSANTWTYVAVSFDGTNLTYCVNGVFQTVSSVSNPTIISTFSFFSIGSGSTADSESFGGKIPIMRLYDRALTALELKQNFSAQRGRYSV